MKYLINKQDKVAGQIKQLYKQFYWKLREKLYWQLCFPLYKLLYHKMGVKLHNRSLSLLFAKINTSSNI